MSESNSTDSRNSGGGKLADELRELRDTREKAVGDEAGIIDSSDPEQKYIRCTRCEANRIARSRPQGLDNLRILFVPTRAYRCLHCYHRFWHKENFFVDKRRPKAWAGVVALLLSVLAYLIVNIMGSHGSDSMGVSQQGALSTPAQDLQRALDKRKREVQRALVEQEEFASRKEAAMYEAAVAEEMKRAAEFAVQERERIALEEMESLLKVQISLRIEQWRKAWETGSSRNYFASYAVDFEPADNQTLLAWRNQRKRRVHPSRNIELMLGKFDVSFRKNHQQAAVLFDQQYSSGSYTDISRKELLLNKEGETWKIVREQERN